MAAQNAKYSTLHHKYFPAVVTNESHFGDIFVRMDKPLIQSLSTFCADQHELFDRDAWIAKGSRESAGYRQALAVVAKYLSTTIWYGHAEDLDAVATGLHPPLAEPGEFERVAKESAFDAGRFSGALRYQVARRQMQRAVQDPAHAGVTGGATPAAAGIADSGRAGRGMDRPR